MADTANRFVVVGTNGDRVLITARLKRSLPKEEALNLAAWIVAVADPERKIFDSLLKEIVGNPPAPPAA